MSEMPKILGVTSFVSGIKRVENFPDFEILAHVIPHGLQGFSQEANFKKVIF